MNVRDIVEAIRNLPDDKTRLKFLREIDGAFCSSCGRVNKVKTYSFGNCVHNIERDFPGYLTRGKR